MPDERMLLIGGRWLPASDRRTFPTVNPATGEVLAHVPRGASADVDLAVAAARQAFATWAFSEPAERGRLLYRMAQALQGEAEALAQLEMLDNGKPLRQARSDVQVAARYFEYYAGVADKIDGRTVPLAPRFLDYTLREPLGVCALIVPWNYPLQISARGIAAALAAGNTVVLKPAEETPLTALELGRIAQQVGIPDGVLNVVTGFGEEAGAALANHPDINQLTFTGSVEVGTLVMQAAARNIVPVVLELGGKSPNLVFADAPLDTAIPLISNSILQNAGQTCSAGSRLIVERSLKDEFIERLLSYWGNVRLGPGASDPDLGPLASERQYQRVQAFLALAREEGARVLQPAVNPPEGWYVPPTILDGVQPTSRLAQEEIFGPVVAVFAFDTEEEALHLANSTPYGLVAGVWTRHVARAHRLARRIRAGQVFINTYGAAGGVEMPFGGYGKSGFGREKGLEALLAYTQVKNVCLNLEVDS